MNGTTPTPRAYVLGAELRDLRGQAGLGLRQVAKKLDISHSVIVRWEKGERTPSTESVSALLAVIGVSSADRDRIIDMVREVADEPVNTVSVGIAGMAGQLTALLEFERVATRIVDVSPLLVPGLLQSAEYVRLIMGTGLPPAETDTRATLRLGRRDVIMREKSPVAYTAFIGESVLRQPLGDAGVLQDQLRLLLKLSEADNIDVRVIPSAAGFTPAHAGPFVLLEFDKAAPVVHLEHHRSSAFLRDPEDVQAYTNAVNDIATVAMSAADSAGLIAEEMTTLEAR